MATRLHADAEVSGWSDAELVRAGSTGDRSVFVELYRRHADVARRAARGVAGNDDDAAEAAAEAFARVFDLIVSGRAPAMEFRAYLIGATRNAAIDQRRRSDRQSPDDLNRDSAIGDGVAADGPTSRAGPSEHLSAAEDSKLVTQAFQGLPARWQSVLWLTEVEGVPAREAADVLGLTPNNVAQLAVRARARLRERYLQAHVRNHAQPQCQRTVDRLGAYLAGTLTEGQRARVDGHLRGCPACRDRLAEVEDLGVSLRRALAPVPLLAGALGWLRRGSRHHRMRRASAVASVDPVSAPAPAPARVRAPARATAAGSRSALFQTLASMPVSAAVLLFAAGATGRWILRGVAALLAAVPILSGVGSHHDPVAVAVASPVQPGATTTTVAPPAEPAVVATPEPVQPQEADPPPLPATSHPVTTVAEARGPVVDVFDGARRSVVRSLDNPQPSGAPLVFVVLDQEPDWLRVMLPTRPNGSTGWVRRQDVSLSSHTFSIVVELAAHRITVFRGTDTLLSEPAGVGTTDTPTPVGAFYTRELMRPVDSRGRLWPGGAYGPYAYGLSAYSDVLTDFAGGDGEVGIHGTNDPSALGHDVSHGCIRMSNEGITRLARTLPLGVPVDIRA